MKSNRNSNPIKTMFSTPRPIFHGLCLTMAITAGFNLVSLFAQDQTPTSEDPTATTTSSAQMASENVLALNEGMRPIYMSGLRKFQQDILDERPVIIALFTGGGGEMTLFRPGMEPLVAATPPMAYQYAKSCGHSAMAMYPLVVPFLDDPEDTSWMPKMRDYLAQHQSALATLDDLEVSDPDRQLLRTIIEGNIAFMEDTLNRGTVSLEALEVFAKNFKPLAEAAIAVAANAQVSHWMGVMDEWKELLSEEDWEKLIAATNSIYVTRQNNILFSILAQYMGRDVVNDRLILFETTSFETTKEQMLSLLTRIIADRSLGDIYFNAPRLMDFELLGSGARKAIIEQSEARDMEVILPPMAPFNTIEWPWHTDPNGGSGPATIEETN